LAWKRSKVRFQYYQAEVYFRLQNYEQARSIYSEVFKQARSLKWQQMRTYAANWLAEIALQEKQYETAQSFIFAAIEAIQEYDDPRSRGFLHRSEAKAKAHYATWQEAQAAAQLAIDAFARVGLLDQVHELKHDYQLA